MLAFFGYFAIEVLNQINLISYNIREFVCILKK